MMAATAPGTAIAVNRNASRVAVAEMTRMVKRGSAGDASAAISARQRAIGTRNHPDLPKSVTTLNGVPTHAGRWSARSTAHVSTKIIRPAITTTDAAAHAPMRPQEGHLAFAVVRGVRTSFPTAQATLASVQRGQDATRPAVAAPPATLIASPS